MLDLIGNLTPHDLDTILHIVLEVNFCGIQLKQTIGELCGKFPTVDDHFDSFDEPLMRGLLTQTSVARKLATHTKSIQSLRQEAMESDSSVPTAVVSLMESYLTPLL